MMKECLVFNRKNINFGSFEFKFGFVLFFIIVLLKNSKKVLVKKNWILFC